MDPFVATAQVGVITSKLAIIGLNPSGTARKVSIGTIQLLSSRTLMVKLPIFKSSIVGLAVKIPSPKSKS